MQCYDIGVKEIKRVNTMLEKIFKIFNGKRAVRGGKKNCLTVLRSGSGENERKEITLREKTAAENLSRAVDPDERGRIYSLLFTACSLR